ncbi:hypothetical protein COUCH_23655 [Couchioplanes caeruleus]|uniref:hypothetical protein n=1 Tax=Couchioplanes caeruleus TaxID=56438 RepID=UPI0020BEA57E|nr:hypothetical protein [Couchioplanes caeruleus]UQU62035.1 hypothetical protein COUCH_23655 [Couchioplanes caeruleus]
MTDPSHPSSSVPVVVAEPTGQALKNRKKVWYALAGMAGLLTVVGTTVGVTLAATSAPSQPKSPSIAAPEPTAWQADPAEDDIATDEGEYGATEPTPGPTPAKSDIVLTPKVTEKHCFGSAGCNVDVKVKMAYGGPVLSADDTFEVTYEVTGDEDGPVIGTLEVTGDQYTSQEESLSTRSSGTKISIKVTDVEKVGI